MSYQVIYPIGLPYKYYGLSEAKNRDILGILPKVSLSPISKPSSMILRATVFNEQIESGVATIILSL